jgi:hypothetical protein
MENVLFNYVVGGVVIEGPMSYASVLERTGLKDTVGLTELGYIEHMPAPTIVELTSEQILAAMRNSRNYFLQQSDWTQVADAPLSAEEKVEWTAYRQALRDMPTAHAGITSFADMVWPTAPDAPVVAAA